MCELAGMNHRDCLISPPLTPFGQSPETGCRNKKKHLIPPLLPPVHPRRPNNRWLREGPECHQVSMLIASGLTDAVPVRGGPEVGGGIETPAHFTATLKSPLGFERRKKESKCNSHCHNITCS